MLEQINKLPPTNNCDSFVAITLVLENAVPNSPVFKMISD